MSNLPSLTALRTFSVAGSYLNFTDAAVELGVTQSAVSRQVKALEDSLDLTLFERVGNTVSLTSEGEVIHRRLFDNFDHLEEIIQEAKGARKTYKYNLLVPPTLATRWLSGRLSTYLTKFQEIDLAVHTSSRADIRMDCIVQHGSQPTIGSEYLNLFMEEHIAVCSPMLFENQEALRKSSLLKVFDDHRLFPLWDNWLEENGNNATLPVNNAAIEFSMLELAVLAAKNSVGVAIVDKNLIEQELSEGSLVQLNNTRVIGPDGYWLEITEEQKARRRSVDLFRWVKNISMNN